MHGLYSRFPAGWTGFALMLLRAAVGATLIFQGAAYFSELRNSYLGASIVGVPALVVGLALLVGLFTRIFGGLAVALCAALAFAWLPAPSYNLFSGNLLSFDVIVMALVSTLLGPGSISLDAHFFGRRKIVIPNPSTSQASFSPSGGVFLQRR